MPYGHIRQYRDLVKEAQKKRIQVTKEQQKEIRRIYAELVDDLSSRLSRYSDKTLTYRWLKDYAKELKRESKGVYQTVRNLTEKNMLKTANAVTDAERSFWGGIMPELSERFSDVFSSIPKDAVDELLSGGIYKDFSGLSERIWNYRKKFDRDIQYIINQGIVSKKSAYDLVKDLEIYLDPKAKKPFDWSRVYPGVHKSVDYNAQRLARTAVTHAYQMSFQRSTKDNPFIEKYKWLSSNGGRTCELCRQRDGRLFEKDELPLDHPNGMCTVAAVISKSYEEIAGELADWVNGKESPELDRWLGSGRISVKASGNNFKNDFSADLKYLTSKDYQNKFRGLTSSRKVDKMLYQYTSAVIKENNGKATETIVFLDSKTGKGLSVVRTGDYGGDGIYVPDTNRKLILTHNHSASDSFSIEDIESLNLIDDLEMIAAGGHDGTVYTLRIGEGTRLEGFDLEHAKLQWQRYYRINGRNAHMATEKLAEEYGWEYKVR